MTGQVLFKKLFLEQVTEVNKIVIKSFMNIVLDSQKLIKRANTELSSLVCGNDGASYFTSTVKISNLWNIF